MDADPWRNPFVEESQPKASTSSLASSSLRWTPKEDDDLEDVAVTAPGHSASASWDPVGDESDSVWTWQAPSKPEAPPAPHWEPAAFETRSWSPPPVSDAYVVPKHADPSAENLVTQPTSTETPSTSFAVHNSELGSPWSAEVDDVPRIVTFETARQSSPPLNQQSPPLSPVPSSPIPASLDGFGTFEEGAPNANIPLSDEPSTPWSGNGPAKSFDPEPSWGSVIDEPRTVEKSPPKDEWAAATAAREERDRVVVSA